VQKLVIYLITLTVWGATSKANGGPVYYSACDSNWVSLQQFCSESTCESLVLKNECGCDVPAKEATSPSQPTGGGSGGMNPAAMSSGGGAGFGFGPGFLVPGALVAFAAPGSSSPKTILEANQGTQVPGGGGTGGGGTGGSGGQNPPPAPPGGNGQTHVVPEAASIWAFGIFAAMMGHWVFWNRSLRPQDPSVAT
jgi:hypothetical protein